MREMRCAKDQTFKVIDKQTSSRCEASGTKLRYRHRRHSSVLTCFSIYVFLNLDLKGGARHLTTNKQFSQNSISVFINTHYCLCTRNSQQQACRNQSCCELQGFSIGTVYYDTFAYNQAVNIADSQTHCTVKTSLNY